MEVTFAASAFPLLAMGFFGLGTGYLIDGPQELAGWPERDERVDRATGVWGVWMPGFCQLAEPDERRGQLPRNHPGIRGNCPRSIDGTQ